MNTSLNGREMIESFEGLRLTAYSDVVGIPTIGYGHTKNVKLGDQCTSQQADILLREDLRASELAIECSVKPDLNQNQFDALVSLVFNIGGSAFEHSTLLRLLNELDFIGASSQFLVWDRAGGNVISGLTQRRLKEKALFDTPVGG